jgi:tetratricopeptide (TPR) repeat protein
MKAYVYTDKSLERYAGRFVWLSINTEDAKNAGFLTKFRIPALPTLLILDPSGDSVVLRYVGGATVGQLSKILDDSSAKTVHIADKVLASADKLAGAGKQKEAVSAYAAALANAPRGWARYPRAAEAYVTALAMSGEFERCATEARRLLPTVNGTMGASIAGSGLGCALELEEKHSQRGELISLFETTTHAALKNPKVDISADDRSSLYIMLIGAREALKDQAGEKAIEAEWVAFLEDAAARAKTKEQRSVYDSHRLSAYMEVGTPEKAIPMLEQSERDFPDDYNPPARLAAAYRAMKDYDRAVAAADRALARAYGPRKLLIYRTKAETLIDKGDKEAAKATLTEAIAYAKSLPKPQQRDSTVAAFEKKLTELKQ